MRRYLLLAIALPLLSTNADAQRGLAESVRNAGTRTVAFSTRSRDETCGDGIMSYSDGLSASRSTRYYFDGMLVTHDAWDTRIPPCERGPLRVFMRVVNGTPSWLRAAIGPEATLGDTIQNLGNFSTVEASAYLAQLVKSADGRASTDAMSPLTLVDSAPRWEVLAIAARDTSHLLRYRHRAADILARGAASTLGIESQTLPDDDASARREAVYAIARQREQKGDPVPDLLQIARTNPHRDARVAALHELGNNADARAIELFTSMLKGRR